MKLTRLSSRSIDKILIILRKKSYRLKILSSIPIESNTWLIPKLPVKNNLYRLIPTLRCLRKLGFHQTLKINLRSTPAKFPNSTLKSKSFSIKNCSVNKISTLIDPLPKAVPYWQNYQIFKAKLHKLKNNRKSKAPKYKPCSWTQSTK